MRHYSVLVSKILGLHTAIQFGFNTLQLCFRQQRTGPLAIANLILASF